MNKAICATLMLVASATGVSAQTPGTGAVFESETMKVWFDDITLVADGQTITHLTVHESDIYDYTAYNMIFTVPEGVTIAMVKKGREEVLDVEQSVRATSTHSIAVGQPKPDEIRAITFSTQNDVLYPDDEDGNPMDDLYTIGLIASPDMFNGEYEVEMWDVKFVLANTDAFVLKEPYRGIFTVIGGNVVTSINEVSEEDADKGGEYFDLLGRPAGKSPRSGIYVRSGCKVVVR